MTLLLSFTIGAIFGIILYTLLQKVRLSSFQELSRSIISSAEVKANNLKQKAEFEARELEKVTSLKLEMQSIKFNKKHEDLEEKLKKEAKTQESRFSELTKKEKQLASRENEIRQRETKVTDLEALYMSKLENVSNLSKEDARLHLKASLKDEVEQDCEKFISKKMEDAQATSTESALRIVQTALSRVTLEMIQETSLVSIHLPKDTIKAKIIGKDGRNIRAFEATTGVSVIIDETPAIIFLSCFDPMRLHLGKIALLSLIENDKINPSSIEEAVKKAEYSCQDEVEKFGRDAAAKLGISNLHPEIIKVLGKLYFRTSAGQNVLHHSIEVSNIMGILASELKLNVSLAQRIGLLHDIGKALDISEGFSHAISGQNFALCHGEDEFVANGIGSHHNEVLPKSHEASLLKCADFISASRLGARASTRDIHFKKLESLEKLASSFPQVLKAFAMDSGKELMVIVTSEETSTFKNDIARNIAKKIKETGIYSHSIRVSVISESKVSEFVV